MKSPPVRVTPGQIDVYRWQTYITFADDARYVARGMPRIRWGTIGVGHGAAGNAECCYRSFAQREDAPLKKSTRPLG